jgi:hypothetical protein
MELKPLTPVLNSPATPPRRSPGPLQKVSTPTEFHRTSPLFFSPLTEHRRRRAFTAVAHPPRRRLSPGEALAELPVRSSLCCAPVGELWRTGAAGGRAPVNTPPRPGPPSVRAAVGPRWTERVRPVHGGMEPVHGFIR